MKIKQILYYKRVLDALSTIGSCDRAKAAAIIVRDKCIISTGVNGAPRGLEHCDDSGHIMKDNHCLRTVHAEVNAILMAAKNGININNTNMYCLFKPCYNCTKSIINSGIKNVYYFYDYKDDFQKYFEKNNCTKFKKIGGKKWEK